MNDGLGGGCAANDRASMPRDGWEEERDVISAAAFLDRSVRFGEEFSAIE